MRPFPFLSKKIKLVQSTDKGPFKSTSFRFRYKPKFVTYARSVAKQTRRLHIARDVFKKKMDGYNVLNVMLTLRDQEDKKYRERYRAARFRSQILIFGKFTSSVYQVARID